MVTQFGPEKNLTSGPFELFVVQKIYLSTKMTQLDRVHRALLGATVHGPTGEAQKIVVILAQFNVDEKEMANDDDWQFHSCLFYRSLRIVKRHKI